MATLAFEGLGPAAALAAPHASRPRRRLSQVLAQTFCGWGKSGHEMILKTDGTRLYLHCRHCFRETPGWEIERPRTRG